MTTEIEALVGSWRRDLRARNLARKTIKTYGESADQLVAHLAEAGVTEAQAVTRDHVSDFITDLLATRSPSTASVRFRALQQFFTWLVDEEEITVSPMARLRPPKIPEQLTPVLDDVAIRALLKACAGKDFADFRDTAIVRLFLDTGMRLDELAKLRVDDVDLDYDNTATVLGKGRRPRICPFGAKTAQALDRYLRQRARQKRADVPKLWLGVNGRGAMTDNGIAQVVRKRGAQAGIEGLHPHMFRHTFAHEWRRAVELDLLAGDPWPPAPKGRSRRKAVRPRSVVDVRSLPDPQTMERAIAAIPSHQPSSRTYQVMIAVMYYGGLRPSEAIMLRPRALHLPDEGWGRIDVIEADIAFDRSGEPKTGRRTVPIPPVLVTMLREWIDEHGFATDELIFRTRTGNRPTASNWSRTWLPTRRGRPSHGSQRRHPRLHLRRRAHRRRRPCQPPHRRPLSWRTDMGAVGQHVTVCGSALGNRRYAGHVTHAAESLLEEALRLPAADRAQLASGLLASLDAETVDEAAVDEAWSEETERRARTLADGSAELVTWEHLAERIDARRSPNAGG